MKIHNVDFDFDFYSVSDMERYQAAYETMQAATAALKAKALNGLDSLRGTCAVFDAFLADVLGEDYDQKLGVKSDNLHALLDVFDELMTLGKAEQAAMTERVAEINRKRATASAEALAQAKAKAAAASLPKPAEPLDWGDPTAAASLAVAEEKPMGAVSDIQPVGAIGEAASGPVAFPLAAAQPTPQPPVDFAHMNRAQRRAYIQSLKGRK